MAAENSAEFQDEKEILINKGDVQEVQQESGAVTESTNAKPSKMTLYHWTQSFSSQKVRLAIAEKGLSCEEYDVSLPLSEHNEPWFMRLNPAGEVPVLVHHDNVITDPVQIMDYLDQNFRDEGTAKLIPEEGSMYYHRVQHYRELLDSLQMDAYTHGSILHPEITVDSHIPAYATTRIRAQIGNTEAEMKKLAEENPELKDAYMAKTRRLKHKLFDHDNMKYLKKILDELEKVLDQVETELQRRMEETPGMYHTGESSGPGGDRDTEENGGDTRYVSHWRKFWTGWRQSYRGERRRHQVYITLEKVLDRVETELQRRKETPGMYHTGESSGPVGDRATEEKGGDTRYISHWRKFWTGWRQSSRGERRRHQRRAVVSRGCVESSSAWPTSPWLSPCTASSSWGFPAVTGATGTAATWRPTMSVSWSARPSGGFWVTSTTS
ncbi:ganglioside-induced differentiation-associated protein 1 isoform X2 [Salvelinus fontinalis]|uniref:ganglioside-induced differentiation-associated protein 1 isoform X2 n=1 Tax=Salvelinus fontinalis TaxID=8038 RepID=UPI0024862F50|nr:ganglioside-induced differentiation-associated protein 1 isoform X2 [Salvelinus fontinalis]